MHITGQLEGGWTKSQSSKVKKEIDMLINETRPKLRLFGEAVVENASRFSNRFFFFFSFIFFFPFHVPFILFISPDFCFFKL